MSTTDQPKIIEMILANPNWGYPNWGDARRETPYAICTVHQTAVICDPAAMARLWGRYERPGPTASYLVGQDGTAYHCVPDGYASWCAGDIANPNVKLPTVARMWREYLAGTSPNSDWYDYTKGRNPNEGVWLQFEVMGKGTEPWNDAQFATVAWLIAQMSRKCGLPINRSTVLAHADINGSSRVNDPWPPATREAHMTRLITMANAFLSPEEVDMIRSQAPEARIYAAVGTHGALRLSTERAASVAKYIPAGQTVQSFTRVVAADLANPDWFGCSVDGKTYYGLLSVGTDWLDKGAVPPVTVTVPDPAAETKGFNAAIDAVAKAVIALRR